MTSSRLIGFTVAILVAFSVACAIYIYVQQKQLAESAQSSALYQQEKARLVKQLEHDKDFRERLVEESLQHRAEVYQLEKKLVVNERALKAAKALKADQEATDPLGIDPELLALRERVDILEQQKQAQQRENDVLRLAVDKGASEVKNYQLFYKLEAERSDALAQQLKQQKRRKVGWSIVAGLAGGVLGYGLGSL